MKPNPPEASQLQECHLDDLGYCFVKKCIATIESRGLDDQGLYRIGGVNSRVTRLLKMCLDRKNYNQATGKVIMPDFSDPVEWETKTITSALKNYLRNLSEPLMTYNLHPAITDAATMTSSVDNNNKLEIDNTGTRTNTIKNLIQQLPVRNFTLLKILVEHLRNVANHSQKNLMTVSNLGICFGPTLMRGPEENSLCITEIKYSNVVANTLIENYGPIFNDPLMNQSGRMTSPISSTIRHTTPISFHNNTSQLSYNHHLEDQFGLAMYNNLNNQQHHNNHHQYPHQQQAPQPQRTFFYNNALNACRLPYRSNKVITLYACVADSDAELSFGPNEIITDVRNSNERGWLIGTLERNGFRGLLPENYVKFI